VSRQFHVGDRLDVGRIPFRVQQGRKGLDDLVIEVWVPEPSTPGEWRPVEMRTVGMLHAFFCENEDRLYPPPRYLGAECWRTWLRLCEEDWVTADKKLAKEKAWADRKRRGEAA
jgi:hypothetical protein